MLVLGVCCVVICTLHTVSLVYLYEKDMARAERLMAAVLSRPVNIEIVEHDTSTDDGSDGKPWD